METTSQLKPGDVPSGTVLTYEYGIRVDRESADAIDKQIVMARRLYNEIVASIRLIVDNMNTFVMSQAGEEAKALQNDIERLSAAFNEAKARDDELAMQHVAQERRAAWRALGVLLKGVRSHHRAAIQRDYLSRIGRNSSCDTYRIRSAAVANGLGWATANAILDAALLAFKKSFALGRPPRFSVGANKEQDTLTLQFTTAGGVPSATLLSGTHTELALLPTNGCGRRKYGELRFRLGPAKAGVYATGTWQYHRPLPEGSSVSVARLVRRRIGKDTRWAVQLVVQREAPRFATEAPRKHLVAVHMGWAADTDGRRIAGLADCPDPGAATIVKLPVQIEQEIERAAAIQGERDEIRDQMVPKIKALQLPDDPDKVPEQLADLMRTLRPLQPQYVSANRLHFLCRLLRENELLPEWLEEWRKTDRLQWQSHTHIARRARNARRDFYRNLAIRLAREYDAIVIEPLDLAQAAVKVDERSGEKTDLSRKARSGRVVAAPYELESALRWATVKTGAAFLELHAQTASVCGICGGSTQADAKDRQILRCDQCGAELDRKQNGAARGFQMAMLQRENAVAEFWTGVREKEAKAKADKAERLTKVVQARQSARTRNAAENASGSRET